MIHNFMLACTVALVSGAGLALYLLLARPVLFRRLLSIAWGLSHAAEDGLSSFRRHQNSAPREMGFKVVAGTVGKKVSRLETPPSPLPLEDVRGDVVDALVGLGMTKRQAVRVVGVAPGEDFETIFRFAVRPN